MVGRMGVLGGLLGDLLDLLLPQLCAGCGRSSGLLCASCLALLTGNTPRPAWPATVPRGLPRPWAAAGYEGPVRSIIVAHKERGRTPLAAPLGTALAAAIRTALPRSGVAPLPGSGVAVVPVPSSRAAVRERGHDPTLRMAVAAVRELRASGTPVIGLQALRHRRRVSDQAGLSLTARASNLEGALEAVPGTPVGGRPVVLADDVITSGATLAEAARALRSAGAEVLAAATVAATPSRAGGIVV
jgi:predicted amidophosphoribosyltransferase